MRKDNLTKRDLSILIGNGLDHYDTAIYGFIAPILSVRFFPSSDPMVALILAYSIIATSVITRPIGSIIFGNIVRKSGANFALSYSLIGVAITTMSIGFIPTYEVIGWFSPFILTIIRTIQSIFAEGENSVAKLYILENKIHIRAIKSSYLYQLSTMLGIIIASFVSTILISSNHHEYWRLCFIIGGSSGIIGYYLRRNLIISQVRIEHNIKVDSTISYILMMVWNNKLNIIRVSMVTGFSYMTYVVPFILMNSFIPLITSVSLEVMMDYNTILLIIDTLLIPIIGYLINKHSVINIMTVASVILSISIVPLWIYMNDANLWYVIFVRLWIIILGVTFGCPLNIWLNNIFNHSDKYMLVGIANAIGSSIFGRLTPAICMSIWYITNSSIYIALYIATISLFTIWAVRSRS